LTGMRERAAALGGSMTIHSRRGKGTQIKIVLPYVWNESSKQDARNVARQVRRISTARAS
jgi:glucose-6-phosphate-specific signal transduction histidine kinase